MIILSSFRSIICLTVVYGRLERNGNLKLLALKVVAVVYDRWSLTRGSKYRGLTWKLWYFGTLVAEEAPLYIPWWLEHFLFCSSFGICISETENSRSAYCQDTKSNSKNTCVPWYVNPLRWTKSPGCSTSSESLISHKYRWFSSSGPTLKDKHFGSMKHLMLQMSSLVVSIFIITWLVRILSWTGWEYLRWRHSWAEMKWNADTFSPHHFRVRFARKKLKARVFLIFCDMLNAICMIIDLQQ